MRLNYHEKGKIYSSKNTARYLRKNLAKTEYREKEQRKIFALFYFILTLNDINSILW